MKRNPNFANWDGPAFREGDVPCHQCEASGVIEDGEQLDVDDFRDCLCGHCDGTGIEPWRAAGSRDTSNPSRDGLTFPRVGHWSRTQQRQRSLRPSPKFRQYVATERNYA